MRNLIFFLLLLTALPASSQVVAGNYTPGFYSSVNYVKNPSCILNDANITDASGIVSRTTTSPITEGLKASCLIDGTASAQVVKFTMSSFDTDLDGGNCEASFSYRGDASLYKVYVESPVSTKISADVQLTDTGSTTRTERINFPCGVRADAKALVLETTGASPAAIKAGNVYGGKATNVGSTQLISEWTSYTPTLTNGTNVSVTKVSWRQVGDSIQIMGYLSVTGAGSGADFAVSLPTGIVMDTGKFNGSANNHVLGSGEWLDNGTGRFVLMPVYASTTVFSFQKQQIGGLQGSDLASGDAISFSIMAPVVGWAASTVVMPDAQGWYVDATISGANVGLGTTSVSSYSPIGSSSLTMTKASGSADVMVPCSGGNAPSGLTCSAGSELFGAAFNIPKSGAYRVCLAANHYIDSPVGSINVVSTFQLVETSTTSDTILQEGKGKAMSGSVAMSGDRREYRSIYTCGDFVFSSVGQKVVKLMYETEISGTPDNHYIKADGDTVLGQPDVHITVYPLQDRATAILANSVSTSATNGLKTESFSFTCSGSSSIAAQLGGTSWVSSIGNIAAGVCAVGISAGTFSGSPQCQVTWTGGGSNAVVYSYAETSSGFNVGAVTDTGANATSFTGKAMCVGPR